MIRARRRSRRALAPPVLRLVTPLLLTVLGLAPLAATLLPSTATAAALPPSPIQVTLRTLRPVAPQPGDTLVLTGSIRNVSDTPVADLGYQLELGDQAIGSRSEFDSYAADPTGPLTATNVRAVAVVVDAAKPTLAPGAREPFTLSLDLTASLDLPLLWQVRELGMSVTGTTQASSEIVPVGQLRTFLPWAPRAAIGNGFPTGVAWLWPLVDRPHRTASSTWYDNALAPELGGPGRLNALLDAAAAAEGQRGSGHHPKTRNVPITWAIDPMLVSDVSAMTAGYRVDTSTGTTPGSGTPVAKSWLATLRTAVTQPDAAVIPLPYADPDIVAAVRAGFTTAIGVATASGRDMLQQALGAVTLLRYGWPTGGLADQRAINALSASGDDTLVLSDTAVPVFDGPPPVTPSAHTVITTSDGQIDTLLSDSGLDTDVNSGINDPNGSRVALQRFLAETLMIHAEQPGVRRDVVVTPDRRWNPTPAYAAALLADTGKVPWVQPMSLASVQRSALYTSVQRSPLTYPTSARRDELSASYLHRVSLLRNRISEFSQILPQGNAQIRSYTTAEQQTLSSAWRQQRELASDQLAALTSTVTGQMTQVAISSRQNSFVTLTSHGGKVPVTISNNLATPVRVTVQLEANQRLSLSRGGRQSVPIPAHEQVRVDVHAAAKTSGVFPVQVQLLTPKGKAYGRPVRLYIRSTVYGTITLVITGAATAALLVAVAIRLTRRALAARRSAASASS